MKTFNLTILRPAGRLTTREEINDQNKNAQRMRSKMKKKKNVIFVFVFNLHVVRMHWCRWNSALTLRDKVWQTMTPHQSPRIVAFSMCTVDIDTLIRHSRTVIYPMVSFWTFSLRDPWLGRFFFFLLIYRCGCVSADARRESEVFIDRYIYTTQEIQFLW